ncbi:hypothetical protein L2E82_29745 [Cichorium intybus]|uniref:Uncharacterized protein n=1 Tax=Cichorium intybus TaxID=13427 RepID=A0ACB9CYC6_CICIN|nr:hypothetical protein L2E82_29745 [Cichorium intybus]
MDPCPYVRILVGSLGLKFNGGGTGTTPPSTCYCKIKLKNDTTQFVDITSIADGDVNQVNDHVQASFNLKKSDFDKLVDKSNVLKIEVYSGRRSKSFVGLGLLHFSIRVERDPRFVFEFDGEPECSPQVFQVNGNVRQAVFTCKFSFRNREQNLRSEKWVSLKLDLSTNAFSFLTEARLQKLLHMLK